MFTKRTTTFPSTSTLLALALWCSFQHGAFAQEPSPAPQQAPQDGATDTQNAEHTKQAAQKAQDSALALLNAAQVATTKAQDAQVAASAALMSTRS